MFLVKNNLSQLQQQSPKDVDRVYQDIFRYLQGFKLGEANNRMLLRKLSEGDTTTLGYRYGNFGPGLMVA